MAATVAATAITRHYQRPHRRRRFPVTLDRIIRAVKCLHRISRQETMICLTGFGMSQHLIRPPRGPRRRLCHNKVITMPTTTTNASASKALPTSRRTMRSNNCTNSSRSIESRPTTRMRHSVHHINSKLTLCCCCCCCRIVVLTSWCLFSQKFLRFSSFYAKQESSSLSCSRDGHEQERGLTGVCSQFVAPAFRRQNYR